MGFYLVLPLKGGETLQINERTSSQYCFSHVQIVSVTLCHRKEITQSFRINEKKSEPSLLLCTGMTFTLIHTFPYIRRDSRNWMNSPCIFRVWISDYKRPNQQIPIVLHPNWSNQMRLYCDWNINAACGLLHKWNERSSRWSNSSINTVKMWKQPKWYNRSNRTWYQFDWNIHEANAFNGHKRSFYFHS